VKTIFRCLFALARGSSFFLAASLFAQQNKALPDKESFHPTRVIVKFAEHGRSTGQQTATLQQQRPRIQRQFNLLPRVAVLELQEVP
jgi:hypothetical protein